MNRPGPAALAANIWGWTALILLSPLALAAAPFWLLSCRLRGWSWGRGARVGIWIYARSYLRLLRPFVPVVFKRTEADPPSSPLIIAANHQSWLDLYLMGTQIYGDISPLVRAWPFRRLFFFGPFMRLAGYVETEGVKAEDILERCRRLMETGTVILCFPEGTRSPDGFLGRFHSGVFKLAMDLNAPVLPLIINNSGQVMPKGSLRFRPGPIHLEYGPLIRPEDFHGQAIPHGALRRRVREIFRQRLNKSKDGNI